MGNPRRSPARRRPGSAGWCRRCWVVDRPEGEWCARRDGGWHTSTQGSAKGGLEPTTCGFKSPVLYQLSYPVGALQPVAAQAVLQPAIRSRSRGGRDLWARSSAGCSLDLPQFRLVRDHPQHSRVVGMLVGSLQRLRTRPRTACITSMSGRPFLELFLEGDPKTGQSRANFTNADRKQFRSARFYVAGVQPHREGRDPAPLRGAAAEPGSAG